MPKKYTPQEILSLPMEENDAHAATIGQYLAILLKNVWDAEEDFSGKRPFGNSGWQADIREALIQAEAVEGRIDGDGWMVGYDLSEIDALMRDLFSFLIVADYSTLQRQPEPKDWIVVATNPRTEVVEHHVDGMLDESTAKATAEAHNSHATTWKWVAVRLPK